MELFLVPARCRVPGSPRRTTSRCTRGASNGWDPITLTPSATDALADGWTRYNFAGYEGRPAYGEYKALVDTMAALGADADPVARLRSRAVGEQRRHRRVRHHDGADAAAALDRRLHPSQEGLFFEASGTTPYHFLTAAAMSANSSNPVRELRYIDNDAVRRRADDAEDGHQVPDGVHGRCEGAGRHPQRPRRWWPTAARGRSTRSPTARSSSRSPCSPWWSNAPRRRPARTAPRTGHQLVPEPRGMGGDARRRRPRRLAAHRRAGRHDPSGRQRAARAGPQGRHRRARRRPSRCTSCPTITVSNVKIGDQDFSFDVSEVGVPVLVKMSYFPNWKVDGAEGPYRVSPNFMVVVPTDHPRVRCTTSRAALDKVAYCSPCSASACCSSGGSSRATCATASPHPFLGTPLDDAGDDLEDDEWARRTARRSPARIRCRPRRRRRHRSST